MKRAFSKILVVLIIFLSMINFVYADEVKLEGLNISADEVILYNLNDNQIIYERNSQKRVQIASLTKIMTTIVVLENVEDLDQKVTITNNVFWGLEEYAQAGFKTGQKLSYRELLYGVMLPSGADAVNAVVLSMGTEEDFIDLMNKKVQELNLENTHFDNAIGMDSSDNYSTASDLATLLIYALENEEFKKIFTTKEYKIERYNITLKSTLLRYSSSSLDISDILGAKSGFTDGAGLCLASIANIDDINYLLIDLGSKSNKNKTQAVLDTLTVYNFYKENYSYITILKKGQLLKTINNKFGYEDKYKIYATSDLEVYLKNDLDINNLIYKYEGVEEINYKYKMGDKLGMISILNNDDVLATFDVYLNDELDYYYPYIYIIIFIFIVLIYVILRKRKRRKKCKKRR